MNYQAPLNKPMTAFYNPLCYHRRVSRHFTVRWPTRITSSEYYKIPSASKILIGLAAYWGDGTRLETMVDWEWSVNGRHDASRSLTWGVKCLPALSSI